MVIYRIDMCLFPLHGNSSTQVTTPTQYACIVASLSNILCLCGGGQYVLDHWEMSDVNTLVVEIIST